ncbi:helix-turn-helix transcriptional regulator [Nitrospirillum viridazoti]|uniref:AraC family transcriptional regulator n=1 Tax=Nitrospirillum viridazoti CBAmc TaxID=1441467 RepID=A0A248JSZ6_9PROT|nr:helix-turn-helix transcriptional regulator [Nitrospirillum amazonense]ASG21364.1 AraC family transcriptional regulator [Nitrospirillum amazonense CBAmc]TWB33039.1 AraC family transcriptional regulator [Nitrospirillum amazonense]
MRPVTAAPKGVLAPGAAAQRFRLGRYLPAEDLAAVVEHYWVVAWDLTGQPPYIQRTLPYPAVNLVFERGRTAIYGPMHGIFAYELQGAGRVLGIRFRPAGFRALLGAPLTTLVDRTLDLAAVFGTAAEGAEAAVLAAEDDAGMVAVAEPLVRQRLMDVPATVVEINRLVALVEADRDILRVDDLVARCGLGVRALQRLFADLVGMTPKWVIRRARLHEAAHRLGQGEAVDLTTLAQDLGYFDHAHFTQDFKQVIGQSPSAYREACARKNDSGDSQE